MPGSTTPDAFPYPLPSDPVADYPAVGQDLATKVQALATLLKGSPSARMETVRVTATPDANGNFNATHELGVIPDVVIAAPLGPATGNAVVGYILLRAATSTGLTLRAFTPAGVGSAASVTAMILVAKV